MLSQIRMAAPPSPLSDYDYDQPVVPTNELGMVVDENAGPAPKRRKKQDVRVVRQLRVPRKYVSKHFSQAKPTTKKATRKTKVKVEDKNQHEDVDKDSLEINKDDAAIPTTSTAEDAQSPPALKPEELNPEPRIFYGLNVDALSSDSELSDVPSDLGPDPFQAKAEALAFRVRKKPKHPTKSPYFPTLPHKHRQHFLTTLPFPPLTAPHFGLMQERLAHDPYRLLLATIFLNKTPGERAMPIFFELMKQYPTPQALSEAKVEHVTEIIRTLGFQNQRARKCVAMAKEWLENPPGRGRRYRKLNYPAKGDGRDVKDGECIGDEDDEVEVSVTTDGVEQTEKRKESRVAWEISHLPGLGPYSHDSWRMFCRDELRGKAVDWLGSGAVGEDFEPEWKRVLPLDKELRAWMTWMWLKEGYVWNKETGQKTKADEELLRMARDGGVVQESKEDEHLIVKGVKQETSLDKIAVEKPAGDFLPK